MPDVSLLTLFAIDSGEQQHFLLTDCAPPERLVPWLVRSMHEISPGSRPTSLEHLRHCILQAGGQPLEGSEDGRCLRKHLITHYLKRRRLLISSWSRPEACSPWQMEWLPMPLLLHDTER